ncbi:gp53-like domain-containing protein [Citrobacter freundii]|uniref:gp53-like domain-containing protein n=1 Tax=Citrobacter freundii TaxID=546 RepID=UPI003C6F4AD1
MHRIDTPTAQKDKFGAGKNGFTAGNHQTGTPATDLDNDYFDMLQEELAGVVEATGVNLDKSKHNQLLTALKALLLSRAHPFADIKADGPAAIAEALSNLGLGEIAQAGVCSGVLGVNGYISIPLIIGGVKRNLLIQWGSADFGGAGSQTSGVWNNFTYAFPSESYKVVAIHYGYAPGLAGILSVYGNNKTGFYGCSSLATATNNVAASYIAIGV